MCDAIINQEKTSTFTSLTISQSKIKTKEFAIKAKNHQNFSIYSETFGLILYLQ